jgi:hypothetical protein
MTSEQVALVVSGAALATSVGSLMWQIVAHRSDRPRLRVTIQQMALIGDGLRDRVVEVEAVNLGKRSTTIRSLYLRVGKPPWWSRRGLVWLGERQPKRTRKGEIDLLLPDGAHAHLQEGVGESIGEGEIARTVYSAEGLQRHFEGHGLEQTVHAWALGTTARAVSPPFELTF